MTFYHPWEKENLREQASVIRGDLQPTKILREGIVLNAHTKLWEQAHVWIYKDRIVYVGDSLPTQMDTIEKVDCRGKFLVPGYIEPHAHPFQLYNPYTMAAYAAERGTTTLVSDNLVFYLLLSDERSFDIIERLNALPTSFFWWCRYDAQTLLRENPYQDERIRRWLEHPQVIQGGELTAWPQVLHGDDRLLEWMQMTKRQGKRIEGHLPGASEKTLLQLQLLGVDCDHEAMTTEEAWARLRMGLTTSLRYSSIRPDLPEILRGLVEKGLQHYDGLYMTTDGATPHFYEQGIMDRTIEIALEQGVPTTEAYLMASQNIARHYGLDHLLGSLEPGRMANINILSAQNQPTPISVLAKGEWVKRNDEVSYPVSTIDFKEVFGPLDIPWELTPDMLEPPSDLGLDMANAVITKPFTLETPPVEEELPEGISYLTLIDVEGHWKVSTYVKGFAELEGFASSFSSTGDLLLIGKHKKAIVQAFERVKTIKGGIVLIEQGESIAELRLPIRGWLSDKPMKTLAQEEQSFVNTLREKGYDFADPIYSLLFFSSTHLPYIRITPLGLVDVMKNKILQPVEELSTI
ncbi:adenine deaminase [Pullulanibacillus pueri]|uniref:adenine deaminase n=1 Tax=Pullulanibacillus pueri TaxID=1437324 RepID=A0A8J2ZW97_9BACL|nr:adenine deaminase C-terminal domain-containing protein [Pullulanibacillus pueri]MBM7682752.1 adenine deaminase [Pullulanibacillus pueri]GGH83051.1 putative adenine deaminase [Pullulanibacillus pueri]